MMKILDRYIAKTVIASTAFVVLVLLGIQSFLELVQQFRHIGQARYNVLDALLYVPMQLPAQLYQLFPMAGFLGCLIGLGRLSTSSQLIVMRASGISIARIAGSVLKAAILMIVLVTAIGEWVGPKWQQAASAMRRNALQTDDNTLKSTWIRENNTFTRVGTITKNNTIANITRYQFDHQNHLINASFAKTGRLEKNGQWRLYDLTNTLFLKDHTRVQQQSEKTVNLLLKPNLQVQIETDPTMQSFFDLQRAIGYRKTIGLSANQLIYILWQRLLQPITSLIMICLGVPFVFGSLRSSTMGVKVMTGVVVGFAFYMMNQLFGPVTLVYQYPPILAAVTPTVIFGVVLLVLLMRVR